MTTPLTIWFLSDNKAGHASQLQGLERALSALNPIQSHWLPCRIRDIHQARSDKSLPKPDMIIAAGHSSHKALLFFTRLLNSFSVVLMKPSLPLRLFNAVICPAHDRPPVKQHIFTTLGPLNSISPSASEDSEKNRHLILLGGPSKHFKWHSQIIIQQIRDICHFHQELDWELHTSRRTPPDLLEKLALQPLSNLKAFPLSNDLHQRLLESKIAWVSPDSASMVYEALTAGAQVAALSLPPSQKNSRVRSGLSDLHQKSLLVTFEDWQKNQSYQEPVYLNEADRAARWLIDFYGARLKP